MRMRRRQAAHSPQQRPLSAWRRRLAVAALTAAAAVGTVDAQALAAPPPTSSCGDYQVCKAIAELAYTYAYPLVMVGLTRDIATNVAAAGTATGRAPVNQFSHNQVPEPTFTDVVLPSVSTPYSVAWLDLADEPMILHIPDTKGRYFLVESMDAWTDVLTDSPGSRTGTTPGDYAYVGPNWKGTLPAGIKKVYRFSTNTAFLVGRNLSTGTPEDLDATLQVQKGYTLTPLHAYGRPYTPPTDTRVDGKLDMSTPFEQIARMSSGSYFQRFAQLWKSNPPRPADKPAVDAMRKIGLVPGRSFDVRALDPVARAALRDAAPQALGVINQTVQNTAPTRTNWTMNTTLGQYGTRYLVRAGVARGALGANYSRDAIYAGGLKDITNQTLNGNRRYTMRFEKGQLPPVNPKAFWSVTVYDMPGQNLYANSANRFALGIPAAQGHLPCFAKDGSLTFYLQHTAPDRTREPGKYCNWLPTPTNDFVLLMRMYWPSQALFNGSWQPPAIIRTR